MSAHLIFYELQGTSPFVPEILLENNLATLEEQEVFGIGYLGAQATFSEIAYKRTERIHRQCAALAMIGVTNASIAELTGLEDEGEASEMLLQYKYDALGIPPEDTIGRGGLLHHSLHKQAGAAPVMTLKPAPKEPRLPFLTSREVEVVAQVAHGSTNKIIAGVLGISVPTVKTHLSRIGGKLGVGERELIAATTVLALSERLTEVADDPRPKAATSKPYSRLSEGQKVEALLAKSEGIKGVDVARRLGVHPSTISRLFSRYELSS